MRLDAAALRAEADAHEERLKGPLWADGTGDRGMDLVPARAEADVETVPLARPMPEPVPMVTEASRPEPAINPAPTRSNRRATSRPQAQRPSSKRGPGRPPSETARLPARELRIPTVIDARTREVAAWEGIEPIEAMWSLCTRGWEAWRSAHGAPAEIPT